MQKSVLLLFTALLFSQIGRAQEIKTKVQESGFEVKPDAQKEEQFEPANFFVFAGAGIAIRTGNMLTGFLASDGKTNPKYHKSNDDDAPLKTSLSLDLGLRYFLDDKWGIGLRGNYFVNQIDFYELDTTGAKFKGINPSSANTRIGTGAIEGIYRHYFTTEKSAFAYAGLGLGYSYINQEQNYIYGRKTIVNQGFFMARPFVGVNVPVWDVIHFYAEAGYQYSQGKISDGTLSLSQLGITAGIHIRLNAF